MDKTFNVDNSVILQLFSKISQKQQQQANWNSAFGPFRKFPSV